MALPGLGEDQVDEAEQALAALIDLVRYTAEFDVFRSEDPVQAAGFVVSDHAEQRWTGRREHNGFVGVAPVAARHREQWESRIG